MPASAAHIAGVGVSHGAASINESTAIQAGVKALLDAGVTYGDIDHSVACFLDDGQRIPPRCFDTLGMKGAAVSSIDNSSGLFSAVQYIRSGQANCVLVIGIDRDESMKKSAAVGVVLVSGLVLNSHAYLKDSAVCISACCLTSRIHSRKTGSPNDFRSSRTVVQAALRQADLVAKYLQIIEARGVSSRQALGDIEPKEAQIPKSLSLSGVTGWLGLCGMVWQLRGWAHDRSVPLAKNCMLYTSNTDGGASVVIMRRSDDKVAPAWNQIENVREGRERLGYNPAMEERGISREDLENVRAPREFSEDGAVERLGLAVKGGDRAALARL